MHILEHRYIYIYICGLWVRMVDSELIKNNLDTPNKSIFVTPRGGERLNTS